MTNLTLLSYFFFVFIILVLSLFISTLLISTLPALIASTVIILLVIVLAFFMVKVLFAPLVKAGKNIDSIIKETLHELNIPLATIDANTKLLQKHLEDTKKLRQLERIQEAAKHLLHLHKGLEYHIKKEFAPSPLETFDLQYFLEERIDHYQTLYPHVLFDAKLHPLLIKTDRHGLQQSIDNIVANSVKYAKKEPHITLTLTDTVLEILDNGKGMDETTLVHIFERYYQADRSAKGQGIGLSVVKAFCDTHKIRLTINSKSGSFTKVVLNFSSNLANKE